jgi:nucleotidyltransferase/DNA polymerase involved in DNA repair
MLSGWEDMRLIAYVQGTNGRLNTKAWDVFCSFTPQIELVTDAAAFIDLSGCGSLPSLLRQIDQNIYGEHSIGIATTKLLAKAAVLAPKAIIPFSVNLTKVLRLHKLKPCAHLFANKEQVFLANLPIEYLNLGPSLQEQLNKLGLFRVADVLSITQQQLIYRLGTDGTLVYQSARGIDHSKVEPNYPPCSIVIEKSLDHVFNQGALSMVLMDCCTSLSNELRQTGKAATLCRLALTTDDGQKLATERKLSSPSNELLKLWFLAQSMLNTLTISTPLASLKLTAIEPVPVSLQQLSLFERPTTICQGLNKILSNLRYRFADTKTYLASQIQLDRYEQMLSFYRHE